EGGEAVVRRTGVEVSLRPSRRGEHQLRCVRISAVRRATLPAEAGAGLAGIALAALGELAVEAGEQPGIGLDRELGSVVDAGGVARRARAVDGERRPRQRDEGGRDIAGGTELVHPR